jgi:hypothetical protein
LNKILDTRVGEKVTFKAARIRNGVKVKDEVAVEVGDLL